MSSIDCSICRRIVTEWENPPVLCGVCERPMCEACICEHGRAGAAGEDICEDCFCGLCGEGGSDAAVVINKVKGETHMRAGIALSVLLWGVAGYLAMSLTGCAGLEIGGKAGIYAVDDRQETQVTRSRAKPMKCLWANGEGC